MNIPCVPVEALLTLNGVGPYLDVIQFIEEIEVIFGRDSLTNEVFLIYGRERINQVIEDCNAPMVDTLIIELNRQSDELNQVLALVQLARVFLRGLQSPPALWLCPHPGEGAGAIPQL